MRVADTTDVSVTNSETDVDGSVRLAGGLAVEKSAAIKAKLSVLSATNGDASGIGAALYVKGGYHAGGDTYVGGGSMIELAGKSAKVGKSVNVTDSSSAPATVATLRLKPARRLGSRWTSRASGRGARPRPSPPSLASTTTAAPRRNRTRAPPRRAPAWSARRSAWERLRTTGTLSSSSHPTTRAGGVGAEKDFAVKVFTADAGSGNAPALATALVVARVTGDFVSLT